MDFGFPKAKSMIQRTRWRESRVNRPILPRFSGPLGPSMTRIQAQTGAKAPPGGVARASDHPNPMGRDRE
jgi:hypothetical protein